MKTHAIVMSSLASLGLGSVALAQCGAPAWHANNDIAPGTGNFVGALANWDPDGAGPLPARVVVAGGFASIGGVAVGNIATWDGTSYTGLGGGVNGEVNALAVLLDGRLAVAGSFTTAGGVAVNNVAIWDGTTWSSLGAGVDGVVWALATNPVTGELIAGGMFTHAGGAVANRVAKWDGSAWSTLGSGTGNGVNNIVYALTAMANGDVIVGGAFTSAGGVFNRRSVARYGADGAWYYMAAGMNAAVLSLTSLTDGSVVASGIFTFADIGNASRIARWDGTHWYPMGLGLNTQALALLPLPGGQMIAGGHFFYAGSVAASKIALWDGANWASLGVGMDQYVDALLPLPNGHLLAGGGFTSVDGISTAYLADWGAPVCCPADLDDGSGTGTPDNGVDINDLLYFLAHYEAGC